MRSLDFVNEKETQIDQNHSLRIDSSVTPPSGATNRLASGSVSGRTYWKKKAHV